MKQNEEFLAALADRLNALSKTKNQLVAIDGVDGAGKTVLANHLADKLRMQGRRVIRASIDGFHHPRAVRYQAGKDGAGFYRGSYNYDTFKNVFLNPLGPNGNGIYKTAVFNVDLDEPVQVDEQKTEPESIVLVDGIFLHRPELREYWDYSIFLKVPFEVSIPRGAQRGNTSPDLSAASNQRYIDGQKLYMEESNPEERATLVIDYSDLSAPKFLKG